MKIIELILDETSMLNGVDAISIVEHPAIEGNFIALNRQHKVEFAEQSAEKKLLIGPALIPNKTIYRNQDGEEFYVFFSKTTIRRAAELFLMRGYQNNHTLEHQAKVNGLSVVESWIIEDPEKDKSSFYGLSYPAGTWMVSVKVNNDDVWNEYVKSGSVKGFSIEGYFADKINMGKEKMESFSDYPDNVKANARNVLDWVDKNGWGGCGTNVGKQRANQLAKGEGISLETIKRMYSYLSRHKGDLDSSKGYSDGCGKLMYDAWGGKSGLNWSRGKLRELGEIEAAQNLEEGVPHYTADGKLYDGPTHEHNGRLMTGETHTEDSEYLYHEDELMDLENEIEAQLALTILNTLVKINE